MISEVLFYAGAGVDGPAAGMDSLSALQAAVILANFEIGSLKIFIIWPD